MDWFNKFLKKYHKLYDEKGAKGVQKEIRLLKKKNIIANVIAKFDNEFWGVQRFIKDIVEFEDNISNKGLQSQCVEFLDKLKITVAFKNNQPDWINTPNTSVLFYSNHEALIDPIFYGAMIKRNDIAILGTSILSKVGPNAKKHILPLMASQYGTDRDEKISFMHKILERGQGLTSDEIKAMNENTLQKSVNMLVKENSAIGMFPSGAAENITHWYNGIGRIVSKIGNSDRKKVLLSPILFEGVKRENILLVINKVYAKMRNGLKPQTLTAKFGEVRTMYELVGSENDPKKITEILRKDFFREFEIATK